MAVQKAVLVANESETSVAKLTTKRSVIQSAQMVKNQQISKNVTLTNVQSGKLASGRNAQKRVVVEDSIGKQNSFLVDYNEFLKDQLTVYTKTIRLTIVIVVSSSQNLLNRAIKTNVLLNQWKQL